MFHALATNQDYWKERINVFIACAPVVMPNKKFWLFGFGSKIERLVDGFTNGTKLWELFGNSWSKVSRRLRTWVPGFTGIEGSSFTAVEYNDKEAARVLLGHYPHGASARQIVHYGQIIKHKQFQYYDYR